MVVLERNKGSLFGLRELYCIAYIPSLQVHPNVGHHYVWPTNARDVEMIPSLD